MAEQRKREVAYKLKIGDLLRGTPIVEDIPQEVSPDPNSTLSSGAVKERFRFLELDDKRVMRVNIIGNIVDKYVSEGDKKFINYTLDDASGQIRLKIFGEDVSKYEDFSHGDTLIVIGVLRSYNKELYVSPEIIKKADPRYLLIRKLELEKNLPKKEVNKEQVFELRDQIIQIIKNSTDSNGASTEDIILKIKTSDPTMINEEIIKLIEDGIIYEPRPGKVRYLG